MGSQKQAANQQQGERMGSRTTISATKVANALRRRVRAALRQALEAGTREIYDLARARWPIDTGTSRDGISRRTRHLTTEERAGIRGAADYTRRIRLRGSKLLVWDAWIAEPMRELQQAIARRAGRARR